MHTIKYSTGFRWPEVSLFCFRWPEVSLFCFRWPEVSLFCFRWPEVSLFCFRWPEVSLFSFYIYTCITSPFFLHFYSSPKRNSLPELPLSPREREILEKTSEIGIYDNNGMPQSKSSDSVTVGNGTTFEFPPKQSSPPPKPPLPQNADVIVPQ